MDNGLTSSVDVLTKDNELVTKNSSPADHNVKNNNFLTKYSKEITIKINEINSKYFDTLFYILLNLVFVIYFGFATKHFINKKSDYIPICDDDEYGLLILLLTFIYLLVFYSLVFKPYVLPLLFKIIKPIKNIPYISSLLVKKVIIILLLIGILIFLIVDCISDPNRLIALGGLGVMILYGFITSTHPGEVKWEPVILGLILQFVLGLFTIRWQKGRNIFKCAGDKVYTFSNYTTIGSSFVYGNRLIFEEHVFAFNALSVIFFLSFFVKILYFYGIIQKVVLSLGYVLQSLMGTTICESVNSAANIFLGMTEAPILLEPYLQNLTHSETFAVMTAGFASVSGTVLAAYINFGAKPVHLITASVMSAPAALCYSKLTYPETEISLSTTKNINIPEPEESSVLDAASRGASQGILMVLGIIANVIAFVTFITFLNGVINWFGILVGHDNWSVQEGLSYVFMPLSFLMGIPWAECKHVGKLIGIKTVINEFLAYKELGVMTKNNLLSPRSEAIATYAICGFSNPGSIGIMISTMGSLMPNKREAITKMVFKSFVAGAVVCFMTASIAGILIAPDQL